MKWMNTALVLMSVFLSTASFADTSSEPCASILHIHQKFSDLYSLKSIQHDSVELNSRFNISYDRFWNADPMVRKEALKELQQKITREWIDTSFKSIDPETLALLRAQNWRSYNKDIQPIEMLLARPNLKFWKYRVIDGMENYYILDRDTIYELDLISRSYFGASFKLIDGIWTRSNGDMLKEIDQIFELNPKAIIAPISGDISILEFAKISISADFMIAGVTPANQVVQADGQYHSAQSFFDHDIGHNLNILRLRNDPVFTTEWNQKLRQLQNEVNLVLENETISLDQREALARIIFHLGHEVNFKWTLANLQRFTQFDLDQWAFDFDQPEFSLVFEDIIQRSVPGNYGNLPGLNPADAEANLYAAGEHFKALIKKVITDNTHAGKL